MVFFKKEIGFENYLVKIKNLAVRTQVTKSRLSNHHLMIEVGRHKGTPKDLRFCPFCPQYVENEFHFLLECSMYKNQREIFIKPLTDTIPWFIYLTEEIKLESLLYKMAPSICNYIANCFEMRAFFISNPKRLN